MAAHRTKIFLQCGKFPIYEIATLNNLEPAFHPKWEGDTS
jgi:hypothetical protein